MSKKSKRWLVLGLFFAFILTGCKCDDTQIGIMEIFNDNPLAGEVISTLLPTFNWHNSENCWPDKYVVHITDNSEWGWSAYKDTLDESPTYTMTNPLDPGKEYVWEVKAHQDSYGDSGYSEPTFFYTGPVCSGESLIAPDLQNPQPAGWVEQEYVFTWTYNGGCLPVSYEVQFARDAAFTDIYLTAVTSDPHAQHLLMAFPDCSSLFWRVRAFDGTSFGPWSDSRDFHYVISEGCYQWNYLSDDFAWIHVRLYKDVCSQTGFISSWTAAPLNPGCKADSMIIVGDGTSYSGMMNGYTVDLGAGPCPSTGLDQIHIENNVGTFGVLTPGTYCVTISRDQTTDVYDPISLMGGIWTNPQSHQILAQETIDFGPGNSSYMTEFVWDEIDRPFLTFPLDYTYACKIGPEKLCPTYGFAMEGDAIPIYARDTNSEYKLTEINGVPCYLLLGNDAINKVLDKIEGVDWRAEDLEFFPKPDPCPKPDPKPGPEDPASQRTCSDYKTKPDCDAHAADGCTWAYFGSGGACFGP